MPRTPAPGAAGVTLGAVNPASGGAIAEGVALAVAPGTAAAATLAVAPQLGQLTNPMTGREWLAGDGTTPSLTFRDANALLANRAAAYEAGAYLYTLKPATMAAPSAPTGTVTTTVYPTLTAQISAVVESWQLIGDGTEFVTTGVGRDVDLPPAPTWGSPSPPANAVPAWGPVNVPFKLDTYIDGVTPSTVTSPSSRVWALKRTFVLYVGSRATTPRGRLPSRATSGATWVQNAALPTIPYIADLQQSDTLQAVQLGAQFNSNGGFDPMSGLIEGVQRKVGSLWRAVRGASGIAIALDGGSQALPNDFECDRGVTNCSRGNSRTHDVS